MNDRTAELYVQCHRAGKPSDPLIEKAVRVVQSRPALHEVWQKQTQFDEQILGAIGALQPPTDVRDRLSKCAADLRGEKGKKGRSPLVVTAMATVVAGALLIAGLAVFVEMDRVEKFPGRDAVTEMLKASSAMTSFDLEPAARPVGEMGDWFYMRGFEGYTVPERLEAFPTVGSRVFRIGGMPIAQMAVERHRSFIYLFRANDFGVDLPLNADWKIITYERWVAALWQQGDLCAMVAFQGEKSEMREFLRKLP